MVISPADEDMLSPELMAMEPELVSELEPVTKAMSPLTPEL